MAANLPEFVFRSGLGVDIHAFAEGRRCVLGGVEIPNPRGLLGHSDADAVVHAVCDALLGAMGLADIGAWFPDNDATFKDIDSLKLLQRVYELMEMAHCTLVNLDVMLLAEEPRVKPHREAMKVKLSLVLHCRPDQIAIKASTMEGMGFVGRREGVLAQAVVSLYGPSQIQLIINPDQHRT